LVIVVLLQAATSMRTVDLPHGIQRHRIMWVREMDKAEARQIGQAGPTIDKIDVAEFESQEEVREWVMRHAPAFLRGPG
jgi:hypothetical protein